MASNIRIHDIEFPSQPSISTLLTSLKRSTLTIHNRLTSILSDAEFVQHAAQALKQAPSTTCSQDASPDQSRRERLPRPLVANERCGSWYIRPEDKHASAYFKSTDGHERAWKFSTRRLNLHLIDMIEKHDGIIIVDSTRRGKRMPDALSTTIPTWCTVINTVLLPSHPLSSRLFLPPHLLPTTHAQITALLPQFVASLQALKLQDLPVLTKPLRPFWVTRDSVLPSSDTESSDLDLDLDLDPDPDPDRSARQGQGAIYESYRPVICLTASRRTATSEMDSNGYIQGAADDTENWAHGLTPSLFWANKDALVSAPESQLPDLISSLMEAASGTAASGSAVQLTPRVSVSALPVPPCSDCCVLLTNASTPKEQWVQSRTLMEVGLGKHKTASRNLRTALPEICSFVSAYLEKNPVGKVLVACESGRDTSVGTALALSCYLFDDEGTFRVPVENMRFTKTMVKVRLGAIMTAYPGGNPSRQTLQSVNSFLMDWTR